MHWSKTSKGADIEIEDANGEPYLYSKQVALGTGVAARAYLYRLNICT